MTDFEEIKYIEAKKLLKFLESKGIRAYERPIDSLSPPELVKQLIEKERKENAGKKDNGRNRPPVKVTPLTEEELASAWEELVITEFLEKWPRTERYWSDPSYKDQVYCMSSFVPAPGATPDKDGVYGMMKIRGVFSNEGEMRDRCRELIEKVDSDHKYFQAYVGRPFPCTLNDKKFCAETETIDIKSKAVEAVGSLSAKVHKTETEEQNEVKQRTEDVLARNEEEKKGNIDPLDRYTELRVKRANIVFNMVEHKSSLANALWQLKDCLKTIDEMDAKDPKLAEQYLAKYKEACGEAGIRENENTLIKYLTGELPFDVDNFVIPVLRKQTETEKGKK